MYATKGHRLPVYYRIWRKQDETDHYSKAGGPQRQLILSYSELAKVAGYLDHKTLIRLAQSNRKLRVASFFGCLDAYARSEVSATQEETAYGALDELRDTWQKMDI